MTESMTQPVDPAASVAPEETAPPEEGDANGSAPETAPEMEPETVETTEPVATSGPSVGEDESVADGGAEPEPEPDRLPVLWRRPTFALPSSPP